MATIWDEAFQDLARLGLLDVVLPFVLIFAIVYGALDKTKILRGSSSYKNINQLIAFSISFIAIASAEIVGGITVIAIYGTMGMVAMLMLAVLFGIFGFNPDEAQAGFWVVIIAVSVGLFVYFLDIIGIGKIDNMLDVVVPGLVIALVFASIVWFITSEEPDVKAEKKEAAKPAEQKPGEPKPGEPKPGEELPKFENLPGRLQEVGRAKL